MNHLYLLSIIGCFACSVQAQHAEWACTVVGNNTNVFNSDISVQPGGDAVFATGMFSGVATFDPGGSNVTLSSAFQAAYVTKRSENGQFLWARLFSGNGHITGATIETDNAGNCYFGGSFSGSIDCDPGPAVQILSAPEEQPTDFLVKLDADGQFVWGYSMAHNNLNVSGCHLSVTSNAIYCAGVFTGTHDFDNGPGTYELTAADSCDIFVMKLNTDGGFEWVKSLGSVNNTIGNPEYANGITVGAGGDIFITGSFSVEGDFNPEAGETLLTPDQEINAFIMKLSADGDFEWAKRIDNTEMIFTSRIAASFDGSVFVAGTMVEHITSGGNNYGNDDAFLARYSSQGDQLWLHRFGGMYTEQGNGLAVDETGSAYLFGDYASVSVDFNPGPAETLLETGMQQTRSFLTMFTTDGALRWAHSLYSPYASSIGKIDYEEGMLYAGGYFYQEVDVDPGPDDLVLTVPNTNTLINAFTVKYDTIAFAGAGIGELSEIPFILFPNPVTEKVTLTTDPALSKCTVTIYNLAGQPVFGQQLTATVQEMDLSHLPAGAYLVELQHNGLKGTRRLIKR